MLEEVAFAMTAAVHLVRHCPQPEVYNVLCGRVRDEPLAEEGKQVASRLAQALAADVSPLRIETSPRRRAMETAEIIGEAVAAPIEVVDALDEIDFGDWAGRSFAELEQDVRWRFWNAARDRACSPGGETMHDAVERAAAHIAQVADDADGPVICVTHADIIRGLVAHYLGLNLDRILHFDIDPGSVSTLIVDGNGGRVAALNRRYS
jgi:broad specificity phosphatase PhoE